MSAKTFQSFFFFQRSALGDVSQGILKSKQPERIFLVYSNMYHGYYTFENLSFFSNVIVWAISLTELFDWIFRRFDYEFSQSS
jgi:hypothetical protein